MKGKFSSIWRVTIALVLVASLGLVFAAPAAAAPDVEIIDPPGVTVLPSGVASPAQYTIDFRPNVGLYPPGNVIIITFPPETTVPGSIATSDVTVEDVDDAESDHPNQVDVTDNTVTVYLPPEGAGVDIDYRHHGRVTFDVTAGLINPSEAGQYCLYVSTDEEPNPVQACYYITTGPVTLLLKHVAECEYIEYEFESNFETIQEALDWADFLFMEGMWKNYIEMPAPCNYVGATIVVQPGTYYETIVMDTPGVELVSAGGAEVTIIDAYGLVPPIKNAAVFINAGEVTFKGFTVINAGVGLIDGGPYMGIAMQPRYCDEPYKCSYPIYYGNGEPTSYNVSEARVNILDNIVHGCTGSGIAVWGGCVLASGNTSYNNGWAGFYGNEMYVGVETIDPPAFTGGLNACCEVTYNEFYENYNGVVILSLLGDVVEERYDLYIVGNDIHDNDSDGIYLGDGATGGYSPCSTIAIKLNQIEDNGWCGIETDADYPIDIVCSYNDIVSNEVWGIKNWEFYQPDPSCEDWLVAPLNYYGHISGPSCGPPPYGHDPSQQSEALGSGDAVSHGVIYKWWLTDSFKIVQAGLKRHYGSDCYGSDTSLPTTPIVPLVEGWNTLSTPVALDERADQMGEIVGLGGWMQNYMGGYTYDPIGGWDLLDADSQLVPLEAVYVRMAGDDMLPILLRNTDWLPARDLEPGWNLVGPNFGFWSQNIWNKPVDYTLASIAGSWGVAISPDIPGQQDDPWVCTPADAGCYQMYVGDGYWLFVTEPTTLAGFRMAPWYLQEWEMEILNCLWPPWYGK